MENLEEFLKELARVTKKVIFLCVPNISAIGYISQKYFGKEELKKYLKEEHIFPESIKKSMADSGWELRESNYIDCPPWPDIGMAKKKFLSLFCLGWLIKDEKNKPLCILDYYTDKDPLFREKMMKYYFFEKKAPSFIKKLWAHLIFVYMKTSAAFMK